MTPLATIEREAEHLRAAITELEGLTQRFDAALARAETERNLHLSKIMEKRCELAELKAAARGIIDGFDDLPEPELLPPEPATDSSELVWPAETIDEALDVLFDAPAAEAEAAKEAEAFETDTFTPIGEAAQAVVDQIEPTFEVVAAAVQEIAGSPPEPDASDEPEMTDEQVERLEEQTREALAEDAAPRELETVGDERPLRRFNPFAGNPFA